MMQPRYFHVEIASDILIATPIKELASQGEDRLRSECDALICEFESSLCKHVLIDLTALDYFGSMILELMVLVWKKVLAQQGQFVLCGVSQVGREILQTARFDTVWRICETRDEGLRHLQTAT